MWSRTSPAALRSGSTLSSVTWNSSVMRAFRYQLRQAISGLPTSAAASSLLPTLTTKSNMLSPDSQKWPRHRRLLPTLTSSDYGSNSGGKLSGPPRPSLQSLARELLPTLTASSAKRGHAVRSPKAQGGPSLEEALLPTLCARDSKGPGPKHTQGGQNLPKTVGGHLSPTFCEWFMGFETGFTEVFLISKAAARRRAQRAVPATRCSRCGRTNVKLERHHRDYQKPVDVEVLCCKCHAAVEQQSGQRRTRRVQRCKICQREFRHYTHSRVVTCSPECLKRLDVINARKRWPEPSESVKIRAMELHQQGLSERSIAKTLGIGRTQLRAILGATRAQDKESKRSVTRSRHRVRKS